jgi:hypothetical protein
VGDLRRKIVVQSRLVNNKVMKKGQVVEHLLSKSLALSSNSVPPKTPKSLDRIAVFYWSILLIIIFLSLFYGFI